MNGNPHKPECMKSRYGCWSVVGTCLSGHKCTCGLENPIPPIIQDLRKAYSLGQAYAHNADSDFRSHWKKADEIADKFKALLAKYE